MNAIVPSRRTWAGLVPSLLLHVALGTTNPVSAQVGFRALDGSGNNPSNPTWGSANIALRRVTTIDYGDLISTPAGANRPSAREVSNVVNSQGALLTSARSTLASLTDYVWQWGQFLDHDLDLSSSAMPVEPFDILVPIGDPWFDPTGTGTEVIPMNRTLHDGGSTLLDPRQQLNEVTSWIDASMVYGSEIARSTELRDLLGHGRLKTSAGDLLPFNENGFPNAPSESDPSFFIAGDVRANEQVALTAMHTLFMREHNYVADWLRSHLPSVPGDFIYLLARAVVGAEIQHITYEEWLPVLLGPNPLAPYSGWDPSVDATIANSFSTSAFRFGHSMLGPMLQRLEASGASIREGPIALRDAFFNPDAIISQGGIDPILRGLAQQAPRAIDPLVVDDVRNFLFGPPGSGGFDLASLNIQRGRDHGLPGYNRMRVDFGLSAAATWSDVTSDIWMQQRLAEAYGTPDDIDSWVGILAEDHVPGALVGELGFAVIKQQFERLRDGDRYWYQIYLFGPLREFVEQQSLASIIRRNTDIDDELQDDVFHSAD